MRLFGVVLGLLLLVSPFARAEEDAAAQARRLYERGMAHYQLGEYDDAVQKWQEGFRVKPVPEFLYNIGQAYRLSQRPEKAIQAYQAFLRMAPKTPTRGEVERHIAALQELVEQNKRAAAAAPPPVVAPAKSVEPPRPVEASPPPATPTPPTPTPAAAPAASRADASLTKAAPEKKPVYKRGWFWGVVAGSAVVVAGAVTLGVVLGTRSTVKTLPELSY